MYFLFLNEISTWILASSCEEPNYLLSNIGVYIPS